MPSPSVRLPPLRLACVALALAGLGAGHLGGRTAPPLRAADAVSAQGPGVIVNLRAGPRPGTVLTVQGRNADDAWLTVADPSGGSDALWIDAARTDSGARCYALSWAGSPAVCARSPDVRAALLAAWTAQGRARPCADAT